MQDVEIKKEIDYNFQLQCRVCLSTGRKLLRVQPYFNVLQKLIIDYINSIAPPFTEDTKLCWECYAQLRKVSILQQQILKANELVQYGQCYIYGSLSALTTVLINEQTHTIYTNEAQILKKDSLEEKPTKVKLGVVKNENVGNDNQYNDDIINENNDDNDVDEITVTGTDNEKLPKVEEKSDPKRKISKWARKRSQENKKPKFKMVPQNDLVNENIFRRVYITVNQLKECVTLARDTERFRASRYRCESCVVAFKNESLLLEHNLRHTETAGSFECDVCLERMTKDQLLQHMGRHFTKYECVFCKYLCRKKSRSRHLVEKHAEVFQCLKCGLQFGCRKEFDSHYKDWHEKFICDLCGVSFKMRYCIKDHLRKQHSTFACAPCGKRFARYNGLWLHNKLRHSPPLSPAYCAPCDTHYRDVYRYRWHLANSIQHRPKKKVQVPCPDCDKVFTKKIYMTNHRDYVHLKQFKFHCEQCNKNFIRNADLVKHRRKVHEGIPVPKNKICYVCGKGFHTNKILQAHLRVHSGERPFACGLCPARFSQRAPLRSHARAAHRAPQTAQAETR